MAEFPTQVDPGGEFYFLKGSGIFAVISGIS